MIQKTNIEIDVPDGYEVIKYDLPKKDDLYLVEGTVVKCSFNLVTGKVFIVERKIKYIFDLSIGQKFRFTNSHEKTIFKIVKFHDGNVLLNRSKIFYIAGDYVYQCNEVFIYDKYGNYEVSGKYKNKYWEVEIIED